MSLKIDGLVKSPNFVIPAETGIYKFIKTKHWIPASAGMTAFDNNLHDHFTGRINILTSSIEFDPEL